MSIIPGMKIFFDNGDYPILLFTLAAVLFSSSGADTGKSEVISIFTMAFFILGWLILFASAMNQFIRKRWKKGFISILILAGGTMVSGILYLIMATVGPVLEGNT